MKLKLMLITLFSIFLISFNLTAFACKGSVVLFQDNFAKLDPSWGSTNDEKWVNNGKLILQPDLRMAYDVTNQANVFQDMDYCLDVRLAKGDGESAGGGLVFWAKDNNDYYFLYTLTDGSYFVGRYTGKRYIYPVSNHKSSAINTAVGAVNHLRVVTKGNQATIYINDTEMTTFTGQPPEGGGLIGVSGDSGSNVKNTWEFSNVKVTKPD